MIELAALLLAAASPQDTMADIRSARETYRQCVISETVRLGSANNESAETILTAVGSACREHEEAMRQAYARAPISELRVASLVQRDRQLAAQDAAAALLAARAS